MFCKYWFFVCELTLLAQLGKWIWVEKNIFAKTKSFDSKIWHFGFKFSIQPSNFYGDFPNFYLPWEWINVPLCYVLARLMQATNKPKAMKCDPCSQAYFRKSFHECYILKIDYRNLLVDCNGYFLQLFVKMLFPIFVCDMTSTVSYGNRIVRKTTNGFMQQLSTLSVMC